MLIKDLLFLGRGTGMVSMAHQAASLIPELRLIKCSVFGEETCEMPCAFEREGIRQLPCGMRLQANGGALPPA